MHFSAAVVELLQDRISDRAANAAADNADLLLTLSFGSLTQGTHKVMEIVALIHVGKLLRGSTDGLDNDGNSALLGVIIVDGDGDTLAVGIHAQDNELAGLGLLGNQRGLDLVESNGGAQGLFSYDTIHIFPSFLCVQILNETMDLYPNF